MEPNFFPVKRGVRVKEVIIEQRLLVLVDPETNKEFSKPICQCKHFRGDTVGNRDTEPKQKARLSRPSRTRKKKQQRKIPKPRKKRNRVETHVEDQTYTRETVQRGPGKRNVTRFQL